MLRSVRWRLVASYVFLTVLTVSLVGVLSLSLVKSYVDQQEIASLRANAEAIARQAEPLLWPSQRMSALQDLAQTAAFLGNDQVRILDADERVVADSLADRSADAFVWLTPPLGWSLANQALQDLLPSWPQLSLLLRSGVQLGDPLLADLPAEMPVTLVRREEELWGTRLTFESTTVGSLPRPQESADAAASAGDDTAVRRVTVPVGDNLQPSGYIQMTRSSQTARDALATTRRALILAGVGAALLAVVLGLAVSRTLTAPLKGLAAATGRMSQGDLSARAPVAGGVELEQLGRQFNEMAGRLESSFADLAAERDALRRFIADASHELRTPITALKNFNELLQGQASGDAEVRSEFLAESQTQIERLEWITSHLLGLSRIDAGLVSLDITECSAGDLVESAAAAFEIRAREAEVALEIVAPNPAFSLSCDRMRMEMALSNLLDNALKFASQGGRVSIGSDREGSVARFWVQDNGPGVALTAQPYIFERFYHGSAGGTGLGLAIVRSIAQAHGGRAYLAETGPSGSRFVIETPLAPAV